MLGRRRFAGIGLPLLPRAFAWLRSGAVFESSTLLGANVILGASVLLGTSGCGANGGDSSMNSSTLANEPRRNDMTSRRTDQQNVIPTASASSGGEEAISPNNDAAPAPSQSAPTVLSLTTNKFEPSGDTCRSSLDVPDSELVPSDVEVEYLASSSASPAPWPFVTRDQCGGPTGVRDAGAPAEKVLGDAAVPQPGWYLVSDTMATWLELCPRSCDLLFATQGTLELKIAIDVTNPRAR